MSQNRSSAVMEQRAPRHVEGDSDQRKRWRDLDFFPTPPWAARAGAEVLQAIDAQAASIWEPACGQGHISEPLREYFEPSKVIASDIHAYDKTVVVHDFLGETRLPLSGVHWVITNPPFSKAAEFVERGLQVAERGVAILCRMAFLESAVRYPLLFEGRYPLSVMAPFIERVPMQLGSWEPSGHSATAYAWFFFSKVGRGAAPIIMPIAPGTKRRLTRPDDARRFGSQAAVPLLEGRPDA